MLRLLRKALKIRVLPRAFHQQVDMVRHEAERQNQKPFIDAGTQEMRQRRRDNRFSIENARAFSGAERQKVAIRAAIGESWNSRGTRHAEGREQAAYRVGGGVPRLDGGSKGPALHVGMKQEFLA